MNVMSHTLTSPTPELRIAIADDDQSNNTSVNSDSGYTSAISPEQISHEDNSQTVEITAPAFPTITTSSPLATPDPSPFANTNPFRQQHPPRRNLKKLSLTSLSPRPSLPSPTPSVTSLRSVAPNTVPMSLPPSPQPSRKLSLPPPVPLNQLIGATTNIPVRRRSSVVSLPVTSTKAGRRSLEDDAEGTPYESGPVEILPGVWLGAEENAQDWSGLVSRGIGAILNVAKEVILPFDDEVDSVLTDEDGTPIGRRFPSDPSIGRPALTYLHLNWSHGQSDLVKNGFVHGLKFIDESLSRNIGVLIHCQCGISRSGTLAIAYVMRAAHAQDAPPHVAALRKEGMQGAYTFAKSKSQWVGPNMSLIYQLLEYERFLSPSGRAPSESSGRSEEEEWTRQRMLMEEEDEDEHEEANAPSAIETAEARELDQRMVDRRESLQRPSSRSSFASSHVSDNGAAWRSRFARTRTLSISSDRTSKSSIVSTDSLLEVNEENEESESHSVSRSRKNSAETEDGEGVAYIELPLPNRAPANITLAPLPPPRGKRTNSVSSIGSLGSVPPSAPASRISFGGVSRPPSIRSAHSRRISDASIPSAPADQSSFFPPPSASAFQTSFGSSTNLPFPGRSTPSPSFAPPSSRAHRRRSTLTPVLEPVPPSPNTPEKKFKGRPLGLKLSTASLSTAPSSVIIEQPPADNETTPKQPPRVMRSRPIPLSIPEQGPSDVFVDQYGSSSERLSMGPTSASHRSSGSISSMASSSSSKSRVGIKWLRQQPPVYPPPSTATMSLGSATPHQTLFIFPTSPTRPSLLSSLGETITVPPTPSTMLLTTTMNQSSPVTSLPLDSSHSRRSSHSSDASSLSSRRSSSSRKRLAALPSGMTPTLAAFRSSIQTGALRKSGTANWAAIPSTPTTATAKVEARGWVMSGGPGAMPLSPLSPLTARAPRSFADIQ